MKDLFISHSLQNSVGIFIVVTAGFTMQNYNNLQYIRNIQVNKLLE